MSPRPMLKSIWTKMPKIPKGVCAGARTSGRACHRRRNTMVCLPCRQLKHTHGKPDSQSCLEFPLEKFRAKFHPSAIQMLALFHGMLLVTWISLSASPTLLPAWHSPSVKHNTHFSQPNPSFCQRTAACPGMQGVARESQACSGLSSVPLSLSPSGCTHWSISISHGAFSAKPEHGKEEKTSPGAVVQQLDWPLNLSILNLIHMHYSTFYLPQKVTNTCQPLFLFFQIQADAHCKY